MQLLLRAMQAGSAQKSQLHPHPHQEDALHVPEAFLGVTVGKMARGGFNKPLLVHGLTFDMVLLHVWSKFRTELSCR